LYKEGQQKFEALNAIIDAINECDRSLGIFPVVKKGEK
jgi:hypothetical protein